MRCDNIIRSFIIASFTSLIAVLLEAAYYGLHPENTYSVNKTAYFITVPFVNNFSDISSPINITIISIIFVFSFVIVSNLISKRERS